MREKNLMLFMKSTLLLILTVTALQAFSKPMPTPLSASWLYSACEQAEKSEYARGFCDGAIETAYSSIQNWCVPEHITHGEVKDYVKTDLLNLNPSMWVTAIDFVGESINRKWPCSAGSK